METLTSIMQYIESYLTNRGLDPADWDIRQAAHDFKEYMRVNDMHSINEVPSWYLIALLETPIS